MAEETDTIQEPQVQQTDDPFAKYGGKEVKNVQSEDVFSKYGGSELKKKDTTFLPNIPDVSGNGSNNFLNTPQSTDLSPVLPQYQDAVRQQQLNKQQRVSDNLKAHQDALDPEHRADFEKAAQIVQQKPSDQIREPSKQEIDHYNYMQTPVGKTLGALQYIGSKTTKGTLQIAKGATYLATLGLNAQHGELNGDSPAIDQAFKTADENTNFGLTKGDQQRMADNPVTANLGGLAEFLPAAAAASGTGGATLYLQGLGQGKEAMDEVEKSGAKINPIVKNAFILGTGAVNGLLMGDLGGSMFKSLPAGLRGDITASITADAIKEAAGKEITGDGFKQLLDQGAKTFQDKLTKGGVSILEGYKHAVTNLSALAGANFALKKAANVANEDIYNNENPGKEENVGGLFDDDDANNSHKIFNTSLGDLASNLNDVATKQAPFFAIPSAIGALTKLTPYSDYKNTVVESLMHDSSPENVEKTKQDIVNYGTQHEWHPDEIKATTDHVDQLAQIAKVLPKNLPENKMVDAVDLVKNRNDMQKELAQVQGERQQLDPAVQDVISPQEQLLTDKVEQANDKLKSLATGSKLTVSKGTGDDEGLFFKTIGGKKEEITESRYKLDALERDSKIQSKDEQTEPNTEVPAEQPADETASPAETPATINETTENSPIKINENEKTTNAEERNGQNANGKSPNESNANEKNVAAEKEVESKSGEAKAEPETTKVRIPQPEFKDIREKSSTPENLAKEANTKTWYHGSNKDLTNENVSSAAFTRPDSLLGLGFYMTDNPEIAEKYANQRRNKSGSTVNEFNVKTSKLLDAEKPIDKDVADVYKGVFQTLFTDKEDTDNFFDDVKKQNPKASLMDYHKAIYEHIADEHIPTNDVTEHFQDLEQSLKDDLGYDGISHIGGKTLGGKNHNVMILLDPSGEYSDNRNPFTKKGLYEPKYQEQKGETDNATQKGNVTKNGEQQHQGTAQGENISAYGEQVREEKSGPTGDSHSPQSKEEKPIKQQSLTDAEQAEKLELRKKFLNRLNDITNIPTLLADKEFRRYAGLVFKEAAGDFKAFSKELIEYVGEKIKEHLPGLFKDLGGKLSDEENKPASITSARNEDTDKIREKLGLSPLMKIAARENPEVWDEVNKTIDENPNATDELVSKLNQKIRPVTDVEQGLLVHRQIELETNVQKANDLVIENKENGIKDPWDQINLQNARKSLSDILELQNKVGREWGLSGKFRQQLFKDDFSLANLERQTRGALGGRELTKTELDNIQKVHDEFNKKVKDYEQTIKDLKAANDKAEQAKALAKFKKEADFEKRKAERAGKIISEKEKRTQTIEDIRAKLKEIRKSGTLSSDIPYRRELAEISPELAKLAKSYISEGITRLEDIVDKIHHDLSDDFPDLEKRDIRDALSGYGNEKTHTKDELQKQLEQLKHQAKLISRLEDLQNGLKKATTEKAQTTKNAEIEELQKQIHELTRGETVNKAYITRMQNMAKEIKNRLAKGDFEKHIKLPVELTPEAREARAGYLRVKRDFDRELERKRLGERSWPFKLADWGIKWRRFVLFANPTTWLKLGTYASLETLSKPLHEIIGSGIKTLPYFSKVAEKAPREGHGFNRHVEAKAFAQLWAKGTWSDILKNIKNKEGDLKASHSDNLDDTPDQPWLDIMQNWHAAIKEIPLHGEVERSIYLRTMHAMKNSIDVSQPLVQMKILAESLKDNLPGADIKSIEDKAYQDGLRSIMMQDNIVSNSYQKITQYLDQLSDNGKLTKSIDASDRFRGAAKGLSTLMKVIIPITKVPVNYVLGRLEYTPVLGAAKALLVMRRGLEKMSPDDADYVMRIMKKQGVGAGMLALGYLNPTNFGGFQVTGDKRRSHQLKANDIKIFGVQVPHFMTHTPFLTILQLGATMRHIHDNYIEGGYTDKHTQQAKKENWYSDAPLAMTRDINKQVPFMETPNELTDAMRNKQSWNKFAADFIEGLIFPPDVKTLAKTMDEHKGGTKKGEYVQRQTNTFGQALKSNIPLLRKTVPIKQSPAE